MKAFEGLGWVVRTRRGTSHVVMTKSGVRAHLSIPVKKGKGAELRPGLLRHLIRDAEITVDEFVDALG